MLALMRSLALMATISSLAGYDGTLSVWQHPGETTSLVGGTVMVTCGTHYHGQIPAQVDVYWYKGEPSPPNALINLRESRSSRAGRLYLQGGHSKHYRILVISNLTLNDAGVYTCEVSVPLPPPLVSQNGNGTRLHVQESTSCRALKTPSVMWQAIIIPALSIYSMALTVAVIILAVLLHFHMKSKGKLITKEISRGPEEPRPNTCRGQTSSLAPDRARETHTQEYEDMTVFRTMNQKKAMKENAGGQRL